MKLNRRSEIRFEIDSSVYTAYSYNICCSLKFYYEMVDYKLFNRYPLYVKSILIPFLVINGLVNIVFQLVQTLLPLTRHFIGGCLESLCKDKSIFRRIASVNMYLATWICFNIGVVSVIFKLLKIFIYLMCVCVPYNPEESVPVNVTILAIIQCILIFYDEFQSSYKILLDTLYTALDKIDEGKKIRFITKAYFEVLCKQYILTCRKTIYLLAKTILIIGLVFIGIIAYKESGLEQNISLLTTFISASAFVLLPEIMWRILAPFGDTFEPSLESEILKDLEELHKLKILKQTLEGDMKQNYISDSSESSSSESSESDNEFG